ncbi:polyamine aminopropyltransferase [Candidatus Erwinia haradaeae]|uniref:Polyamine aminopropyltransferase n=1 Tax=Candidatus Erwinia haradaeae TaxID=1922217 RepID=A0A451D4M0_9GAMM|nr:polyamine aminopropyltransferase [Candidatus Erwinia haradaeae]VFP80611.1 Polyamine aminopropyltransferase [Candidatus Erwinia haradaeae]
MDVNNTWFEALYSGIGQHFSIDKILYHEKTHYQDLMIFENTTLGRIMVLNGIVQTTEYDEFIYHEMMSHVPLLAHHSPRHVLIIGGGDGAILREVSRYKNIQQITMVEIDYGVVELCQKYLPKHNAGAYKDCRLKLIIDDGAHFVQTTHEKFDIIISDSTDPIGPGESLYTTDFYQGCRNHLNDGGIFVAQNGVCFLQYDTAIQSYKKLKNYFSDVSFYQATIPTYYGGIMIFSWASNNSLLRQVDMHTLINRYKQSGIQCRYYNPKIHAHSFALPQYLLNML